MGFLIVVHNLAGGWFHHACMCVLAAWTKCKPSWRSSSCSINITKKIHQVKLASHVQLYGFFVHVFVASFVVSFHPKWKLGTYDNKKFLSFRKLCRFAMNPTEHFAMHPSNVSLSIKCYGKIPRTLESHQFFLSPFLLNTHSKYHCIQYKHTRTKYSLNKICLALKLHLISWDHIERVREKFLLALHREKKLFSSE